MTGNLAGRRIVVTGASRGLGRAVAEAYATEGASLVVTATSEAALAATVDRCRAVGRGAVPVELDLAAGASVDRAAVAATKALGGVDVLVNNAGVLGPRNALAEIDPETVAWVVGVDLVGTLRLTQRLLPAMTDGGAVVNVTSSAAGRPGWGAYALAKSGLDAMSRMLREELASRRIRVVAINPGGTRTAMRAAAVPDEDPATVAAPETRVGPFLAVAAGADLGPDVVQAAAWS